MTGIPVVIVDDHAVVRQGLRALLDARDDIDVVGVAADGVESLDVVRRSGARVVLMDLGMPRMDGVEATRRLMAFAEPPAVIALTMSDDDTSLLAVVRAGARGYLLKDSDGDDVVAAIHAVTAGQVVFGSGIGAKVVALLHAPPVHQPPPFADLTDRERQVLDLVAAGLGNQAISQRLTVTPKTVANTISTVLVKLGVPDRARAAERARVAGLGRGRGETGH
jgi:DNA-binding NarL/FixJ family response regulator